MTQSIITFDARQRGGQGCVRGLSITVDEVLSCLDAGMTEGEIVREYQYLTLEDVLACMQHRNARLLESRRAARSPVTRLA